MNKINVETVLDLKGLLCPIPIVKISKAIKGVAIGDIIAGTATDAGVMMDIPAWCSSTGHELLDIDEVDDIFTFQIKRSK